MVGVRVSWLLSECHGGCRGVMAGVKAQEALLSRGHGLLDATSCPVACLPPPPPQADSAAPGPVHPPWGRPTSEGGSRRGGDQVNPPHVGSQGEQPALSWAVSEVPPQHPPLAAFLPSAVDISSLRFQILPAPGVKDRREGSPTPSWGRAGGPQRAGRCRSPSPTGAQLHPQLLGRPRDQSSLWGGHRSWQRRAHRSSPGHGDSL